MTTTEIKQKVSSTQGTIIQMLGWNEMEYAEYMEEQGLEYLHRYAGSDLLAINELAKKKTYWDWWKNHWFIRDQRFLLLFTDGPVNILCHCYKQQHAAKYLVSDIYPPAVVLGNDFAKMIGELNDEIKR